jgi:excisionase family DNA binding protein
MENVAIFKKEDLKLAILDALSEFESKKINTKLLSINAVAKRLNKSNRTISRLVKEGFIKTTKSGLIPESEIENYLKNID